MNFIKIVHFLKIFIIYSKNIKNQNKLRNVLFFILNKKNKKMTLLYKYYIKWTNPLLNKEEPRN